MQCGIGKRRDNQHNRLENAEKYLPKCRNYFIIKKNTHTNIIHRENIDFQQIVLGE